MIYGLLPNCININKHEFYDEWYATKLCRHNEACIQGLYVKFNPK